MARGALMKWFQGMRGSTTFQLNSDDVVVFVVGPSGSGKSLFVEEMTKSGLTKVGEGLRPCTTKPQAIRFVLADEAKAELGVSIQKNIVFVDTPSFHTGQDDVAEREVNTWLSKSRSKSTLVGVIYMHRVETDPTSESIQKHLDAFANTFPQGFVSIPQRLHAVFSYEGRIHEDKISHRREVFQTQLDALHPSLGQACRLRWVTTFHPSLFQKDNPETAWKAVVALFTLSTV